MRSIIIVLSVLLCTVSNAQYCNCDFLINQEFKNTIAVYESPNGKVVKNVKHDFEHESFLTGIILQDSADHFKVSIKHDMMKVQYTGWLKKADYIGTFTKDYSGKLQLYTNADGKSKIKEVVKGMNGMYKVKYCKKKWPYVEVTVDGKVRKGWLNPKDQCNNPYTTCN